MISLKPKYPLTTRTPSSEPPHYPGEFEDILKKGEKVMRYIFSRGSYPYIFDDPVSEHTRRAVWTVDALDLPDDVDPDVIKRMLWIHDLPEILAQEDVGQDVTSIDKQNSPKLAAQIEEREDRIAREVLSDSDYLAYQDFEQASKYIKSPKLSLDHTPSTEAMIAKIIDGFIEGIGGFNFFVTQWIRSDRFDASFDLPHREVFVYDFTMGVGLLEKYLYDHDRHHSLFFQDLIRNEHLACMHHLWSQIDFDVLPDYVGELYHEFLLHPLYATW